MTKKTTRLGAEERAEIQELYLADSLPWVIGYSGGKDSTAVLRLIYEAIRDLPKEKRAKPTFVVSSDTLVETPIVVELIGETLAKVRESAVRDELPFLVPDQVTPKTSETFWVNLIGKGYPAPTRQFRWCTERMKIDPVSEFIRDKVAKFGEVIVVLGSRAAESSSRAQVMKRHRIEGRRLARHTTLINAFVYTPIETWSADDVWEFLFSGPAPWGGDHQALFDLYKDSNAGECPLVIDTSTPSCGNSRFGCWVCTVVTKDRAIDGLIESGKSWLKPLKQFRNDLYDTTLPENKHRLRHFRRRDGRVKVSTDEDTGAQKHIPGAYWMDVRRDLLRRLLKAQKEVCTQNPKSAPELITKAELEKIRNQWRHDPNEPDWQDSVPKIYSEVMGESIDWQRHDDAIFGGADARLVSEASAAHGLPGQMVMKLIEMELSMEGLSKRSQVFSKLEEILGKDWGEAAELIQRRAELGARLRDRDQQEQSLLESHENLKKLINDAS